MFKLQDSVGYLVNRVASRMKWALETELAAYGLTAPQWAVLATLAERVDLTATEIRQSVPIDKPTLSGVLQRLHTKKLIARQPDPADGRATRLRLTPKAQELMAELPSFAMAVNKRALKGMSAEEAERLRQILRGMLANLD
jgi:DNA-binding MarR family transcriptional regulator